MPRAADLIQLKFIPGRPKSDGCISLRSPFMDTAWLTSRHEPLTVVLSLAIAIYASYVTLDLARRMQATDRSMLHVWLFGGSLAMGTGIWSMHFVGMLGFQLPISLGYGYGYTALSWVAGVGASGLALLMATVRELTWPRLAGGALALGAGICGMHYLGMAALAMDPGIVWDLRWVAVSMVIAVTASGVALKLFDMLRTRSGRGARAWQALAACVMGGAIAGMHYAGMAGAGFPAGSVCLSVNQLSGQDMGIIVAVSAVAMLTQALLGSVLDARLQSRAARLASSLQVANDELQRIAFRDPLTGLPNRLVFEDRLAQVSAACGRNGESLAVLFIDLDGFKPINDSWGHNTGDVVLREIARRLSSLARESDMLARVGGDEFVMLIERLPDEQTAAQVAQRIIDAIGEPVPLQDRESAVSCSIGISIFPGDGPRDKLIANADAAMYTAKRSGGSCFRFFESRMDVGAHELIELQRDLRIGLEQGQLMLHYQPKIHGGSGQITGVEALVRWNHPRRGMMSPGVFIPVAERFGLIGALGQWVIEESCRQVAEWADQGLRMRVAINLSVHQLRQDDLAERIRAAMDRHAVEPSQLTFELTESAAMEDAETTLRTFERLSAIGITLSIDDFGTGYSSLSYLRRLPTQQLKIDRSFVQDLEDSADARAIVNAVVRLAHALGRKVVAEGVETAAQHDILRGFGCDELQGYLFARPMPARQVSLWAAGDEAPPQEFRPSIFGEGDDPAPALAPLARAPAGR